MDLKCKTCGAELKMEYTYCPKCGTKIIWAEDSQLYYGIQSVDGKYKIYKKEVLK